MMNMPSNKRSRKGRKKHIINSNVNSVTHISDSKVNSITLPSSVYYKIPSLKSEHRAQ